jgi:hypothetical protein
VSLCLTKKAPHHEGIWGSGDMALCIPKMS